MRGLILLALLAGYVTLTGERAYTADITAMLIDSGMWTDNAIWDSALYPNNGNGGLTYDAVVNGSVAVNQSIAIDGLTFSGGTISGPNGLTVASFDWQAGILGPDSAITANGGTWTGGTKYLDGTVFLGGPTDWSSGDIGYWNSYPPTGSLTVLGDGALSITGADVRQLAVPLVIQENGAVIHANTSETSANRLILNGGTLQMDDGRLLVSSGMHGHGNLSLASGTSFVIQGGDLYGTFAGYGSGSIEIQGGMVPAALSISGLPVVIDGILTGPGDVNFETVDWRGGAFAGISPGVPGGVVTFGNGVIQGRAISGLDRLLRIGGNVDWREGWLQPYGYVPTTGHVQVDSGGTLTISGTADRGMDTIPITVDSGGVLHHTSTGYTRSYGQFTNNGLVQVDAGVLEVRGMIGNGTVETSGTGALHVVGGNLSGDIVGSSTSIIRLNGTTVTTDSTIMGLTMRLDGPIFGAANLTIESIDWREEGGFAYPSPGAVTVLGGVIDGAGRHYIDQTVRIAGEVDWQAGSFNPYGQTPTTGLLEVAPHGTLLVTGSGFRNMNTTPMTIHAGGTLRNVSTGSLDGFGYVENQGTIEAIDGDIYFSALHNTGVVLAEGGSIKIASSNHGVIEARPDGIVELQGGNHGIARALGGTVVATSSLHTQDETIYRDIVVDQFPDPGTEVESLPYHGVALENGVWQVGQGGFMYFGTGNENLIANRAYIIHGMGSLQASEFGFYGLSNLLLNEGVIELTEGFDLHLENSEHAIVNGNPTLTTPAFQNAGELRIGTGSVVSGNDIVSAGLIAGTGRMSSTLIVVGGSLSSTGTLTLDDVHIAGDNGGTPIEMAAGTLAGNITVHSQFRIPAAATIAGHIHLFNGELVIPSPKTIPSLSGSGTLSGSTLTVANHVQSVGLTLTPGSRFRVPGGIANSTISGTGVVEGVVVATNVNFNSGGLLELEGSLELSGTNNRISGHTVRVVGPTTIIDGVLKVEAGAVLDGPGPLNIHNSQVDIDVDGTIEKAMNATGRLVLNGQTFHPIVFTGAEIEAPGDGAGFGLLDWDEINSINNGNISAFGNIIQRPGTLAIGGDATMLGNSDFLQQQSAQMDVHGSTTISGNATFNGTVVVSNGGSFQASLVNMTQSSSAQISGTMKANKVVSSGQVTILNSADFDVANFDLLTGAKLTGSANLPNTNVAVPAGQLAGIAPGTSPGAITMKTLELGTGATLEIEIRDAGGAAGVEYDTINILETLSLGYNALDPIEIVVSSLAANNAAGLAANFDPTEDYAWTIVSADVITGFNPQGFLVDSADFLNPVFGTFSVAQDGGDLILAYTGAARAGDFDGDDDVDGRDFLAWQRGESPNPLSAEDLALWRANYGAPLLSASASSTVSVPEPGALAIGLLVLVGAASRRRF